MASRKPYPSDVSDEEWHFVAPYLALVREDAPQREYDLLRELFNGLRWVVRTGSPWRYMPHDLPPWEAIYQQTQRWIKAGVFEDMVMTICARSCGFRRAGPPTRARPSSMLARFARPPSAAIARATTHTRSRRAQKCTPRWIL